MGKGDVQLKFAYETEHPEDMQRVSFPQPGVIAVDMALKNQRSGLRFDVKLITDVAREINLEVNWGAENVAGYSDLFFVRVPDTAAWQAVPCAINGTRVRLYLSLQPGETLVGMSPMYSYRECQAFTASIAGRNDKRVSVGSAGLSAEGRDIPMLEIATPGERLNCLVVGRCHSYETAGNFNIEGMINWLLSGDPVAEYFLARFRFGFIPMMNVDGVVNGYQRFTDIDGADLNRDFDCNRSRKPGVENDPALIAHFKVIDDWKPAAYLNIHHWMKKFDDGLIGWGAEDVEVFESFMPALHQDHKRWQASVTSLPGSRSPGRYCREVYGTVGYVLEFPWYGRTVERMRAIGVQSLQALIHSTMLLRKKRGDA